MAKEKELLLTERYGASGSEICYIHQRDHSEIQTLEQNRPNSLLALLRTIFLPQGYPDSVTSDYMSYQIWDTAQAFCSTIAGTIATQEVLRGVGVGDTSATPLAATITWIVKNSCGHLGRIIFAWSHGTYLDAYSKKWRLYADLLNDAAFCTELALPLFKGHVTPVLCMTTMMQSIVGVAGGATRAALTQHHARRGNLADVSAKDSAQETAVNLIASLAALLILNLSIGILPVFAALIVLHMFSNYMAVRSVCLKTLNEPRYLEVIKGYISDDVVLNPCVVNTSEPVFLFSNGLVDYKMSGFRIKMGQSLKRIGFDKFKLKKIQSIREVYEKTPYLIIPNIYNRVISVQFKDGCANEEILMAYFHSVLLAIVVSHLNKCPLSILQNKSNTNSFANVCRTLESADWSIDPSACVQNSEDAFINEPSVELLKFINKIVRKEWSQFSDALIKTGWDLNHHLLMVDEWRISEKCKLSENEENSELKKTN